MTFVYIILYITIGLGVAKIFQKWTDEEGFGVPLDMGGFLVCIIIWPIPLFVLVVVGLAWIMNWFYKLGKKQ
jgi:hypothetical protein